MKKAKVLDSEVGGHLLTDIGRGEAGCVGTLTDI